MGGNFDWFGFISEQIASQTSSFSPHCIRADWRWPRKIGDDRNLLILKGYSPTTITNRALSVHIFVLSAHSQGWRKIVTNQQNFNIIISLISITSLNSIPNCKKSSHFKTQASWWSTTTALTQILPCRLDQTESQRLIIGVTTFVIFVIFVIFVTMVVIYMSYLSSWLSFFSYHQSVRNIVIVVIAIFTVSISTASNNRVWIEIELKLDCPGKGSQSEEENQGELELPLLMNSW